MMGGYKFPFGLVKKAKEVSRKRIRKSFPFSFLKVGPFRIRAVAL